MKPNINKIDRAIRVVIGLTLITLFLIKLISGTLATIGLISALFFLSTGFTCYCPAYRALGISTYLHLNDKVKNNIRI
jgi:hypothetical protein